MNRKLVYALKHNYCNFWIRNDDVSKCSPEFLKILNLYKKYTLKVIFAVIPTIFEKSAIDLISDDEYFVIAQHGYDHKNYLKNTSLNYKSELCKERNEDELIRKILQGKRMLCDVSKRDINIMVPPFNHIDFSVASLLSLHYDTLSVFGDHSSNFKNDVNPNIDLINWRREIFDIDDFEKRFIKLLNTTNNIGICIHHNFLNNKAFEYLEKLFSFICECNMSNVRRRNE